MNPLKNWQVYRRKHRRKHRRKLTSIAWQVFALELDECSSSSARATTQGPTPTHPSLAPSPIPLLAVDTTATTPVSAAAAAAHAAAATRLRRIWCDDSRAVAAATSRSMADQWRRNGVVAPVSKRVVVMGSRRQIDIPGHGVRVALQAEEFPSFRFL